MFAFVVWSLVLYFVSSVCDLLFDVCGSLFGVSCSSLVVARFGVYRCVLFLFELVCRCCWLLMFVNVACRCWSLCGVRRSVLDVVVCCVVGVVCCVLFVVVVDVLSLLLC